MLAALALMALSGRPHSRAGFAHALATVRRGWSKAQVAQLLGPPDDVWVKNDPSRYVSYGEEVWCYGTQAHHSIPTLGYVRFSREGVTEVAGGRGEPPSPAVISEAELVDALRRIDRGPLDWLERTDPLRLIQVANLLIPKGKTKSLAILGEYCRVIGFLSPDTWMFWLVRVMFKSNLPGGVFPVPAIGIISPRLTDDLRTWPTYPLFVVDDIPINLFRGALLGGAPEPFPMYMRDHRYEWEIRATLLRPPDDPFPSCQKLFASAEWPYKLENSHPSSFAIPYKISEGYALRDVLTLVRAVYQPKGTEENLGFVNGWDYDKFHGEFLALKVHWDTTKQTYVREDGAVLPKQEDFPQYHHQFRSVTGLYVLVVVERKGLNKVDYHVDCSEGGRQPLHSAVVIAEDPSSGKELTSVAINGQRKGAWSVSSDEVMAEPVHSPDSGSLSMGSSLELAKGKRVRFVLLYRRKRFVSPIFMP